jgi:hypothetical protein
MYTEEIQKGYAKKGAAAGAQVTVPFHCVDSEAEISLTSIQ